MFRSRDLAVAIAVLALVTSCGTESAPAESAKVTVASDTLPEVQVDVAPRADASSTAPSGPGESIPEERLGASMPTPRSQTVQLDQPALWPASDVVFDMPEQAAASFVSSVLGVEPILGEFAAGDARSGEIQVFSPGDSDAAELLERGVLALRMIGPNDGWFVIAASSSGVLIDSPESLDRIPAGPLDVTGRGRGFESTLVVSAFRSGDAAAVLDQVITSGGAFDLLEPFSATLDLSDGEPGDVIALMVRGDTGLDGDPGDFVAIPVVIGEALPETR